MDSNLMCTLERYLKFILLSPGKRYHITIVVPKECGLPYEDAKLFRIRRTSLILVSGNKGVHFDKKI
jgi:hypothetical protein